MALLCTATRSKMSAMAHHSAFQSARAGSAAPPLAAIRRADNRRRTGRGEQPKHLRSSRRANVAIQGRPKPRTDAPGAHEIRFQKKKTENEKSVFLTNRASCHHGDGT